ncbi:MAG: HupE/UreJ family protein [Acidobacteriota bacterium]
MNRPVSARHFPRRVVFFCLCLSLFSATTALAHTLGENYVWFNFRPDSIDGRFEIHFKDLENTLGLKLAQGSVDQQTAAVRANAALVQDYIRKHFSIGPESGPPYVLEFTTENVMQIPLGSFAQFYFRSTTGPLPNRLRVTHSMLYENDRFHRGLLLVDHNSKTGTNYGEEYVAMVFGPAAPEQSLDLTSVPSLMGGRRMIWQGVLHIWIGIDHILFLIALILPTVLSLNDGSWTGVGGFRRALWNVLKIVTVFTIAHSVTLLLAALGLLNVPSRLVESMIALSIVLVALNNIVGRIKEGSLVVVLCLGLFHGLGFAAVMGYLPVRMESLLRAVVGFNVGVELGQMAIVASVFPILFLLRNRPFYVPAVLKGGSAVLILIASVWFIQRAFGLG